MQESKVNVIFSFVGPLDDQCAEGLVTEWEHRALAASISPVKVRKVARILVEMLQNVRKYAYRPENRPPHIDLICIPSADSILVKSSNLVSLMDKERLEADAAFLVSLPPDDIKEHYRRMLLTGVQNEKGGAGLGMLDMYRKSGNLPHISFAPSDIPDVWHYTLSINIKLEI
jgi:hypothetical protein